MLHLAGARPLEARRKENCAGGLVERQQPKTRKGLLLPALVLGWSCIMALLSPEAASEPPKAVESHVANAMKIKLKIADREITARLINSETARDFVSLLPLTLT